MEELVRRTVGPAIRVSRSIGAGGLWPTLVDPNQLENALLNLCINARDAMPRRRQADHRDRQQVAGRRAPRASATCAPGQYVIALRQRHRHRHDSAMSLPTRLRSVLHHQAAGRRDGPRTVDGLRLRPAVRRASPHLLGSRARARPCASICRGTIGERRRRRARRCATDARAGPMRRRNRPGRRRRADRPHADCRSCWKTLGYIAIEASDGAGRPEGAAIRPSGSTC